MIELSYQQSGIAPRLKDDVTSNRLYEYRISANGRGERKANFPVQPWFENLCHYETTDRISSPFDYIDAAEGVNVPFSGSNLEPDNTVVSCLDLSRSSLAPENCRLISTTSRATSTR